MQVEITWEELKNGLSAISQNWWFWPIAVFVVLAVSLWVLVGIRQNASALGLPGLFRWLLSQLGRLTIRSPFVLSSSDRAPKSEADGVGYMPLLKNPETIPPGFTGFIETQGFDFDPVCVHAKIYTVSLAGLPNSDSYFDIVFPS